jgi:hypothetical protein
MPTLTLRATHAKTQHFELTLASRIECLTLCLFGACTITPRVRHEAALLKAFCCVFVLLVLVFIAVRRRERLSGRIFSCEMSIKKAHYVQLLMHLSIYSYWGYYWREVYSYAPLLAAQIVFAYALDMAVSWWKRSQWKCGFAPIPVVLSTNLFMWFRDSHFIFQFFLIALGLLGKELLTWRKEGAHVHIFNPSAFGLSVCSSCLLLTGATSLTRGAEIAFTLAYPPHIYLAIFLVGLVVQLLFKVTPVTLSAITTLYVLNVAHTALTGGHQFVDSNIPVLVFLGAHLLVTDPATSPRSVAGKLVFGGLYGISVFVLRGVLSALDLPTFYDKLLFVPALNIGVRVLDRLGKSIMNRLQRVFSSGVYRAITDNYVHVALWSSVFGVLLGTGFLHETRGDGDIGSLLRSCSAREGNACVEMMRALSLKCDRRSASACYTLGTILTEGRLLPPDPSTASSVFAQACEFGLHRACVLLRLAYGAADDMKQNEDERNRGTNSQGTVVRRSARE